MSAAKHCATRYLAAENESARAEYCRINRAYLCSNWQLMFPSALLLASEAPEDPFQVSNEKGDIVIKDICIILNFRFLSSATLLPTNIEEARKKKKHTR